MSARSFLCGITATFVPFFDVPVFWPVLLLYWMALAAFTMRRQIKHMIKHKYVPFDFGKQVRSSLAVTAGQLWCVPAQSIEMGGHVHRNK
jgi:Rer1 family